MDIRFTIALLCFAGGLETSKSCPNKIPNGRLSWTCESKVGSTCEYSCYTGYQKKADVASITCLTSTKWSANLHSLCTNNQQCEYEVANGDLDLSCRRNPGDTCSFACHEGYLPSALLWSGTIMCKSDSIWSQPLSSLCEEILCPITIPGGIVSSRCRRTYNVYCDYDCSIDYVKPSAPPRLKCHSSGEWQWREHDGEPCAKRCPSMIKNGEIFWQCRRQPGALCTYSCNSGCSQDQSRVWLSCGNDGQWNTSTDNLCTNCSTTTTARPSRCPYRISNGTMSRSCSRSPYDICPYTCTRGCYEAYSTLRCSSSGHWYNEETACRCQGQSDTPSTTTTFPTTATTTFPGRCPSTISNGHISVDCQRSLNRECDYACDGGCVKAYGSLYCSKERQWKYGDSACSCGDYSYTPDSGFSSSPSGTTAIIGASVGVVCALTAIFIFVGIMWKRHKRQQINNQSVRYQVPATQCNQTAFRPESSKMRAPLYTLPDQENIYTSLQQNTNIEPHSQLQSIINGQPDFGIIPKPGEDPPSYEQAISNPSEFRV